MDLAIKDRPFLRKLEEAFQEVMDISRKYRRVRPVDIRERVPEAEKAYSNLEKLVSERFGIYIRILPDTMDSCYTYNGIIGMDPTEERIQKQALINSALDYFKKIATTNLDIKNLRDLDSNLAIASFFKMSDDFNKLIKEKKIKVDFKNAKIIGLKEHQEKEKTPTLITVSVPEHRDSSFTVRQGVAVLLHEIGHQFNDTAYSSYLYEDVISGNDAFLDGKIFKDETKVIDIGKSIAGEDVTYDQAIQLMITKFVNDAIDAPTRISSRFKNEMAADVLPTRFGYGAELVDNLNKFNYSDRDIAGIGFFYFLQIYRIIFIILSNTIFYPYFAMALGPLGLVFVSTIMLIDIFLFSLGAHTRNIYDSKHETMFKRFRRIKESIIRELRTNKSLSKENKQEILGQLQRIDEVLKGLSKKRDLVETIDAVFADRKAIGHMELIERLATLTDNDLHASATKIEMLLKGK
jgi:hypothetical protein